MRSLAESTSGFRRMNDDGAVNDVQSPPAALEGWSAGTLTFRGMAMELGACSCVFPLAMESALPGRWYYWAISFGALAAALLSMGALWYFKSLSKTKREIARGYTTLWFVATRHPELFYLSPGDFTVISRPHEPRPRNGTRKVIEQFQAQA
jgi:hypothetical protein